MKAVGKAIGIRKGKKDKPVISGETERTSRRFMEPTEPVPDWKTLATTDALGDSLDYEGGGDYEELRKTMPSDEAMEAFIKYRETGNVMNREATKEMLEPGVTASSFVRYEKDDRARRIARVMVNDIADTAEDIDFLCSGELSSETAMPMVRQVSLGDPAVGGIFAVTAYKKKLSVLGFLLYEKNGNEMHIRFLCASKEQELKAVGSTLVDMAKKDWVEKIGPEAVITLDGVPGSADFYEKMGFRASIRNDGENGVSMEWRP